MTLSGGGKKTNPTLLGSALAVEEVFGLFLNRVMRERRGCLCRNRSRSDNNQLNLYHHYLKIILPDTLEKWDLRNS